MNAPKLLSATDEIHEIHGQNTRDVYAVLNRSKSGLVDPFRLPIAGNTFSSSFPTNFLQPSAMEAIVNSFAPLKAWATVFDPAPYSPLSKSEIKYITGGTTTLTDPSNFQTGDMTIAPVEVTVHHYSQPWAVSNSDYQKGLRLKDGYLENALTFSTKLNQLVSALFTASNFPATPIVTPASAFALSDAAAAFTTIKKSKTKNLLLDSPQFANLSHVGGGGGFQSGEAAHGWTGIHEQSDWSAAGANVHGFGGAPNSVAIVTGFVEPYGPVVRTQYLAIEGLGIPIMVNEWYALDTRTLWASFDCIFGPAVADSTAGVLIATATPG